MQARAQAKVLQPTDDDEVLRKQLGLEEKVRRLQGEDMTDFLLFVGGAIVMLVIAVIRGIK